MNSLPAGMEENLIDLNTPQEISSKSIVPVDSRIEEEHANKGCSSSNERIPAELNGNVTADMTVYNKVGSSNNISANGGENNALYISHTESGYLTDSVTSFQSHDRHPSFGSEADKTPCRETQPSSSSENDVTPCRENLISFHEADETVDGSTRKESETFSSNNLIKKTGNDAAKTRHDLLINYDQTDLNSTTQMGAFAKIDLNCDIVNTVEIDEIFTTNFTRPESLVLERSQADDQQRLRSKSDYGNSYVKSERNDNRKRSKSSGFPIPRVKEGVNIIDEGVSKSLPHGQIVRRDTGLIEFIADDLQEKIRRSSPMSKTASDVSSRRSSLMSLTSIDSSVSSTMATSMTSGMSRSYPQSPDCIPPIDPMAIHEIENQARMVADSLDHMMGNLKNNLHKMSAISVGCEEAYKTSVDVTCDSVDSSIKSMYALMAKCEELSVTMEPVYKLADQIKEIKRLLDRFETQLVDKP